MIVDTSAILAILFEEDDAEVYARDGTGVVETFRTILRRRTNCLAGRYVPVPLPLCWYPEKFFRALDLPQGVETALRRATG